MKYDDEFDWDDTGPSGPSSIIPFMVVMGMMAFALAIAFILAGLSLAGVI